VAALAGWNHARERLSRRRPSLGGGSVVRWTVFRHRRQSVRDPHQRGQTQRCGRQDIRTSVFPTASWPEWTATNCPWSVTRARERRGRSQGGVHGKRIPPVPAAPDLARVKFGEAISLSTQGLVGLEGHGWSQRLARGERLAGQRCPQEPGKHKSYATSALSGVRGLQSHAGSPRSKGGNSASTCAASTKSRWRIPSARSLTRTASGTLQPDHPSENAAKAPGEWQTFDITLVDRHVTVVLNARRSSTTSHCSLHRRCAVVDQFRPGRCISRATTPAWTIATSSSVRCQVAVLGGPPRSGCVRQNVATH